MTIADLLISLRIVGERLAKLKTVEKDIEDAVAGIKSHLSVSKVTLAATSAIAASYAHSFFSVNRSLAQTNAALINRLKYTKDIFNVQLELGSNLEDTAAAQQALIEGGFKFAQANRENVKYVTMLSEAFGASQKEVVELARQGRIVGVTFQQIGEAVTRLVQNTELTTTEVLHLSKTLIDVNRALGNTFNLTKVSSSIGGLAGQLKELGASDQLLTGLIDKFSTLEGLSSAIFFGGSKGLLDPLAFSQAEDLVNMIENVGQRLSQLTAGGNNQIMVALGAKMLGVGRGDARSLLAAYNNIDQLKAKLKLIKETEERDKNINILKKQYNEHVYNTGEALARFFTSLKALTLLFASPVIELFIKGLNKVNEILRKIIDKIVKFKENNKDNFALGLGQDVVGSVGTAASLYLLSKAIFGFSKKFLGLGKFLGPTAIGGAALSRAEAAALNSATAQWVEAVALSTTRMGWFNKTLTWTVSKLGAYGKAIAVVLVALEASRFLYNWYNKKKDDVKKETSPVNANDMDVITAKIAQQVGKKNFEDATNTIIDRINEYDLKSGINSDQNKEIREMVGAAQDAIVRQQNFYEAQSSRGSTIVNANSDKVMRESLVESITWLETLEKRLMRIEMGIDKQGTANVKKMDQQTQQENTTYRYDRALDLLNMSNTNSYFFQ